MNPSRPLAGVRVVDLSRHLPGPLATALLADLGAAVVKVEEPEAGDPLARLPPLVGGVGAVYRTLNARKVRIGLDLRAPGDRALLDRMLARADVLVVALRPASLGPLGLEPDRVLADRPRLVYCSITSRGLTEASDRPLHDLNVEAMAGLLFPGLALRGHPTMPDLPFVDQAAGMLAALAVVAALRAREATGRGALVDLALRDVGAYLNVFHLAPLLAGLPPPGAEGGLLAGRYPFYNLYRTRDGRYLTIGAIEPKFRAALAALLGLPLEALGDPANVPVVAQAFARRRLDEWGSLLEGAGIPWAPLLDPREVADDPDLVRRGVVEGAGGERRLGHPVAYRGLTAGGPPPDPDELLGALGLGAEERARVRGVRSP